MNFLYVERLASRRKKFFFHLDNNTKRWIYVKFGGNICVHVQLGDLSNLPMNPTYSPYLFKIQTLINPIHTKNPILFNTIYEIFLILILILCVRLRILICIIYVCTYTHIHLLNPYEIMISKLIIHTSSISRPRRAHNDAGSTPGISLYLDACHHQHFPSERIQNPSLVLVKGFPPRQQNHQQNHQHHQHQHHQHHHPDPARKPAVT